MCAGDFNKITKQDEKLGGALRSHNQMQLFRKVIDECSLWIWALLVPNILGASILIMGILYGSDWIGVWQQTASFLSFQGLKFTIFHAILQTIYLYFFKLSGLEILARRKVFGFKEIWLLDVRCGETVKATWTNTVGPNIDSVILLKVAKYECGLKGGVTT